MMNDTYLYPYSSAEARERDELPLWRESHKASIACRNAIEDAIRQNFDGMHLDKNCITPVLEEYGYKRTAWVLANTLHELKWDGASALPTGSGRSAPASPQISTTTATLLSEAIRPCWMASSLSTVRQCRR